MTHQADEIRPGPGLRREITREIRSIRIGGTAMPRTGRIAAFISAAAAAFALASAFALAAPVADTAAAQVAAGSGALSARTSPAGIGRDAATIAPSTMSMPSGEPTGVGWD